MAKKYIIYQDVATDVVAALKMLIEKIDEEIEYWEAAKAACWIYNYKKQRNFFIGSSWDCVCLKPRGK